MADFLVEGDQTIRLTLAPPYPGAWAFPNPRFMVLKSALKPVRQAGADTFHILSNNDQGIAALYARFVANSLDLYRGIATCHFCWPALKNGLLESEGFADTPTFTMGNVGDAKTRWLPTAPLDTEANAICLQDIDAYTRALSQSEPVCLGISVKISPTPAYNLVCWYNSGEIGVRGPLAKAQYSIETMVWLDNLQPQFLAWPNAVQNDDLPLQRPYKPGTEREVNRWWAKSQDWATRIGAHSATIGTRRGQSMLIVDIYD